MLWIRDLSAEQRRNFWAAFLGYVLDAMDFLFYALVISILIGQFHMSPVLAGLLSSSSLIAAAVGGWIFGLLTDYLGRSRVLVITVLVYSLASLGAATSQGWQQLLIWRIVLGLGMGGEWGAGMALVSETFRPKERGQGIALVQSAWGFGYLIAVILAGLILPSFGWRGLFAVGVVPALLVLWMRRGLREPELWEDRKLAKEARAAHRGSFGLVLAGLFGRENLRQTVLGCWLCVFGYLGYEAVAIWLPTFLAGPAKLGGLALKLPTVTHMLIVFNIGSILGFWAFGWLADKYGRRILVIVSTALCILVTPLSFIYLAHRPGLSLLFYLSLAVTAGGTAYFAYYGMGLSEMFPTAVRGTALGFANNLGRILGGEAPVIIGAFTAAYGFGTSMVGVALVGFALTLLASFFIPETKGIELT